MSEAKKRNRSINFTKDEELTLAKLISKHKNVLECKDPKVAPNGLKNYIWKKVTKDFNSEHPGRTTENLKSKLDNLKTKAKAYAIKKYKGGVSQSTIKSEVALDIILDILNKKSLADFESDALIENSTNLNCQDNQFEEIKPVTVSKTFNIPIVNISEPGLHSNEEGRFSDQSCEASNSCTTNTSKNKAKSKLETCLKSDYIIELIKAKTELVQKKIKALEREEEDRIARNKREKAEHQCRIKNYELDILIKRKQLNLVTDEQNLLQ